MYEGFVLKKSGRMQLIPGSTRRIPTMEISGVQTKANQTKNTSGCVYHEVACKVRSQLR